MIEVRDLTKAYGPVRAVDGVSFSVQKGEVVGFLGPNGAGKTTTIRIMTGFLPATSGLARIAGHDCATDTLGVRRHVGYLPENVPIYPEMRVEEYLHFRARLKRVPRAERKAKVGRAIEKCWLGDTRRRLVGHLSKGYRQRVGLADALVADPPILILDEPTVGLDPNQIREVRSLVKELGKDHTILLSTHILRDVEAVASRVMIIHRGKIARDASLADLSEAAARSGRVRVEAAEDPDTVAAGLRDVPGVTAVERDGGSRTLVVKSEDGRDVRPDIYRTFVQRGWTLVDLRRESETLEDIFYRSTIGADEAQAAAVAAEAAKATGGGSAGAGPDASEAKP